MEVKSIYPIINFSDDDEIAVELASSNVKPF